jgi:hypothetical protein
MSRNFTLGILKAPYKRNRFQFSDTFTGDEYINTTSAGASDLYLPVGANLNACSLRQDGRFFACLVPARVKNNPGVDTVYMRLCCIDLDDLDKFELTTVNIDRMGVFISHPWEVMSDVEVEHYTPSDFEDDIPTITITNMRKAGLRTFYNGIEKKESTKQNFRNQMIETIGRATLAIHNRNTNGANRFSFHAIVGLDKIYVCDYKNLPQTNSLQDLIQIKNNKIIKSIQFSHDDRCLLVCTSDSVKICTVPYDPVLRPRTTRQAIEKYNVPTRTLIYQDLWKGENMPRYCSNMDITYCGGSDGKVVVSLEHNELYKIKHKNKTLVPNRKTINIDKLNLLDLENKNYYSYTLPIRTFCTQTPQISSSRILLTSHPTNPTLSACAVIVGEDDGGYLYKIEIIRINRKEEVKNRIYALGLDESQSSKGSASKYMGGNLII